MTKDKFVEWLNGHGYALKSASAGHLGRQDAWTQKLPGAWPTKTVRYFASGTVVRKESSIGFGAFRTEWKAPYSALTVTSEGKLKRLDATAV